MKKKKLTTREEAFCLELVKTDGSPSSIVGAFRKIYKPTKGKDNYHRVKASKIFNKDYIQARILELRQVAIKHVQIEAADILKKWAAIDKADPSELVRIERNCCRYCYGINYFFQWCEIEWQEKLDKLRESGVSENKLPNHPRGGFGFDPTKPPNKLCKICFGEGVEKLFIADTRYLSENAKALYLGAEIKKDGSIKINIDDKKNARENLARVLGMYSETWKPPGSGEVENLKLSVETLDPQAAANAYQRIMKG